MNSTIKTPACDPADVLCNICGEPILKTIIGADGAFCGEPVKCNCIREQEEREKEEQHQRQFQLEVTRNRRIAFDNPQDAECTFANSDDRNFTAFQKAKKYARNYDEMKKENCGMIILGPNGTGKTHLCKALANSIIDKGVITHVTKLQKLIDRITANDYRDKYEVLHDIGWYEFLFIDEFKIDLPTAKVIEMIVDARYESGKILVISTNIKPSDIINPPEEFKHTIDRIREMCCIQIVLNGDSRRPDIAAQKRERFDKLE